MDKILLKRTHDRSFVDSLRVYVKGGTGGKGLSRYGGVGGHGGSVYVCADPKMKLSELHTINPKLRFIATSGTDSKRRLLVGDPGEDIEIPVPPGVIVKVDSGRILGEINQDGDRVLVARGTKGASPGNAFTQERSKGHNITLDLKLIADIGLVGFPNAGKSTLLRALSKANPAVAAYPFTTLAPNIGVMEYEDSRQIKMADLPGLIEGAHINLGKGHKFLKHVERTKLLLFMVDLQGFRLKYDSPMRSAFETIVYLMKELELYNAALCSRPAVLALNKMDIPGSKENAEQIMKKMANFQTYLKKEIPEPLWPDTPVRFDEIFTLSAHNEQGTEHLKQRLRHLLDDYDIREREQDDGAVVDFEERLARDLTEHHRGRLV